MPEVIRRGPLADLKDRFPHNSEFICPECGSTFRLRPEDSKQRYYRVEYRNYEDGPQWDTYQATKTVLIIPCPVCEGVVEADAPKGWTLEFAQGKTKGDRRKDVERKEFP